MSLRECTPIYIYALTDPRTSDARYVGQTYDTHRRYIAHIHSGNAKPMDMSYEDSPRAEWLRSLAKEGVRPEMIILAVVPQSDADEAEQRWIKRLYREGCKLLNKEVNWWPVKREKKPSTQMALL